MFSSLMLPKLSGIITTENHSLSSNQTLNNNQNNSDVYENNISSADSNPKNYGNASLAENKEISKFNSDINHFDFKVNNISNQIIGARKYFDPNQYYKEMWSVQQINDYYRTDFPNLSSKVFMPKDLQYIKKDEYSIMFSNEGNIVEDMVSFFYKGTSNRQLTILTSKIGKPYDCVYELETNKTKIVNGREVLIGTLSKDKYVNHPNFYFADFECNDISYRIKADNLTGDEFYRIIEGITEG